ncbi:hypothetical protein [Roseibium aggregatum]|nr:hypothetical protein [Roseibium aggregatum]
MFPEPSKQDVFTAHRPSPWPYVGGMLALTGLITMIVVTFSN